MLRSAIICSGLLLAGVVALSAPAQALTMKECGEKYQAAKSANTLNGQTWTDFRKMQCASETTPSAPSAPAAATAPAGTSTTAPAKPAPTTAATKPMAPAAAPADSGNVVFPTAIDPEFSTLTPAKGRIKTCAKQWKANKAAGGNGNLKWIQKGGGYWSECNKHLKG